MTRTINENGIDFSEFPFEQKDIAEVILSHIDIQFALYSFYIFYDDVENKEERSTEKLTCELRYPKVDTTLSESILCDLLSIFDSLQVMYQIDKTVVVATLSSLESKMRVYTIYRQLYEKSLVNPFILTFIKEKKGWRFKDAGSDIYQYRPDADDINGTDLSKEELDFVQFIKQQLSLFYPYYMFFCLGWREQDVAESALMRKLGKSFENVFFLSTPERFTSQFLVIGSEMAE